MVQGFHVRRVGEWGSVGVGEWGSEGMAILPYSPTSTPPYPHTPPLPYVSGGCNRHAIHVFVQHFKLFLLLHLIQP